MEVVGRQRSSSDPLNPQSPERNSSVYGECHLSRPQNKINTHGAVKVVFKTSTWTSSYS